jgi:predicted RecB family nuclease
MPGKIIVDVIESRLKCKYKAHLQLLGEEGEPHDQDILARESRENVRKAATAKLLARHPGLDVPRGLPLSAELLKRGCPLILDAVIEEDDLSIRFDALVRVAGDSRLGSFLYLPVFFHEAEKPTADLRLILAVLAELLGPVQGKVPACGILVHGSGCQERKVKSSGVGKQSRRLLRELRESQTGSIPRLVLNDHCHSCEFRKRCHAEAVAKDDLSLLRGMGEAEVAKYAKRGILTVGQLACTFRPPRRMKKPEDRKPVHSHALQALSIREKKVHVLGSPVLPDSPKRIYFDLEGDIERGFCYLAGIVVRDGDKEERHSFWIDSPAEERLLLSRFLDLVAKHADAWVYAYGAYEAVFLRRVGKATGREEEVKRVLAKTFNVLSVVYLHVYFPVHSNGLKDIAGHLGFRWTDADASGLMSVVWRRHWEASGEQASKDKLTTYNLEDCDALRRVTDFLYAACHHPMPDCGREKPPVSQEVARVEEMRPRSNRPDWSQQSFAVPDFAFVNERAYFDYQRDRVYIRTNAALKKQRGRNPGRKGKKNFPPNQCVELNAEKCPFCGCVDLTRTRNGSLARLAFDLRITRSGIRRWVTRFTTSRHQCGNCQKVFLPGDYLQLQEYFHSLKSWAMYEHMAHRTSFPCIAETARECFGFPLYTAQVHTFQHLLARYYQETYRQLLEKIVAGKLVHADETEVRLRRVGKGYVWVFTNMEEVVFLYKPSREGGFLHDLLKGFEGVLVSDFYAAYDSLDCPQQKCLVHLIRDLNQDLQGHPWDEELKSLASGFGKLLREIVATIDFQGLKQRHLGKHKGDVDRFFESVACAEYRSELAEGYRQRLLKNRGKLFTFLDHDAVPWNNNNAEHAVKQFAYYREYADGQITEAGLNDYLVLLSVRLSCKYKGVSFLKFMLSQETDIDVFREGGRKRKPHPTLELHPVGYRSPQSNRKRLEVGSPATSEFEKVVRVPEKTGGRPEG